jgi:cytochrome c-type biogenesis protein CcmE
MTTGRKLVLGGVIVAGLIAYVAYLGASTTWRYYLTADECVAGKASLVAQRLRVSGRVVVGTLVVTDGRTHATFALEGAQENLQVTCQGTLPDNLAEGIAVLVEGRIDTSGVLRGDKVMTRCASKYQSRQSGAAAETARQSGQGGLQ